LDAADLVRAWPGRFAGGELVFGRELSGRSSEVSVPGAEDGGYVPPREGSGGVIHRSA